jgi:hypothetical protein
MNTNPTAAGTMPLPLATAGPASLAVRALFIACIFLSAFLLFLVQPIIAKQIMPWFGGTSAVWTTCLMFFQLVLLAGYAYSDLATRWLRPDRHALLHIALLVLAVAMLPIVPSEALKPSPDTPPIVGVLLLLVATVGLPYFCLSTTGPLLQAWYARLFPQGQVYRLFALSNLASLAGLLAYPFSIEPVSSSLQQSRWWSVGFAVFALLCAGCAWVSRRVAAGRVSASAPLPQHLGEALPLPPSGRDITIWLLLSAMGSALLLAVTHHITQNVAAVPFLWLLPLSLYLLTFVICFEGRGWYRRGALIGPLLAALVFMSWELNVRPADIDVMVAVPAFSVGLFVVCMFLHGELSLRKPAASHLTRYYLVISLGGAIGGLAVGALAPVVLTGLYELPILLGLAALLVPLVLWRYLTANKAAYVLLALAVAGCGLTWVMAGVTLSIQTRDNILALRNFYAASRVSETRLDSGDVVRTLHNGAIMHGMQVVNDAVRRHTPTTYYGENSGVGLAMAHLSSSGEPRRVGVIGLGAGTMAAHGRAGDLFRFYEINPHSREIAERDFSFLKDSPGRHEVVMGDARLSMEAELARGEPSRYDLLVIDAFSGDSIPVHLITKEAMDIYRQHIRPGGIIAFHVSNLFLRLEPVVQLLAQDAGMQAVHVRNKRKGPETEAAWVLLSTDPSLASAPRLQERASPIVPIPGLALWTDASNNLLQILR